jgi:hypothetical protein
MVLLAIHTMRKRGLTLAEAIKYGKHQVIRRGPPPPPKVPRDKVSTYSSDYGSMRKDTIPAPLPVAARSGSFSSQRPLMDAQRNPRYVLSKTTMYAMSDSMLACIFCFCPNCADGTLQYPSRIDGPASFYPCTIANCP